MPPIPFLSNYGMVLLCIAHDARSRMSDIAAAVQITERATQRIVAELIQAGYVERSREGRRNSYTLRTDRPIALPTDNVIELGSFLHALTPSRS